MSLARIIKKKTREDPNKVRTERGEITTIQKNHNTMNSYISTNWKTQKKWINF